MIFDLDTRLNLFGIQAFRWYAISRIFSTLATGMAYIAMTWFLLDKANQLSAVALLMTCFWLPIVLVGPIAGAIVDKFSHKKLLVWTNGLRFLAFLLFSSFSSEAITSGAIYSLALFQGIISSMQEPLQAAFVRKMIDDHDLGYANTTLDMIYELGNVGGMGLAGFLMLVFTLEQIILFLSLLVLAATCASMFISSVKLYRADTDRATIRWLGDVVEGYRYVKNKKLLSMLYLMQLLILVEFMTAPILLAPYAKNILHATSIQYGQMEAFLSIGLVLGALLMPWIIKKTGEKFIVLAGSLGCIAVFFLLEIGRDIVLTQSVYFIFGLCLIVWPLILTNAQQLTDPAYQGRVSALFNSLGGTIILLIYFSIYFFGDLIAIYHFYKFEMVLALTIFYLLWQYRNQIKII